MVWTVIKSSYFLRHVYHIAFLRPLWWRHNGRDSGVSNHQPHDCFLKRLFRRRSKKTSKLRVTGFVWGIHRGPVNSPHKWPVSGKCFHLMTSSWIFPIEMVLRIKAYCQFSYSYYRYRVIYYARNWFNHNPKWPCVIRYFNVEWMNENMICNPIPCFDPESDLFSVPLFKKVHM